MTLLLRIRTVLGVDGTQDDLLNELISIATSSVLLYCGVETLPTALEFIIVEMVIGKYRRLGTEGLKSEQVDIVRQEFFQDGLALYRPYLDEYKRTAYNSVRFV